MPYTEIAMCVLGMAFYFNAARIEARGGGADHAVLWAALSLLTSILALLAGAGWGLWFASQAGLFVAIAVVRTIGDDRHR